MVVADGKAFTIISRESSNGLAETCVALDAQSGKELWAAVTGQARVQRGW